MKETKNELQRNLGITRITVGPQKKCSLPRIASRITVTSTNDTITYTAAVSLVGLTALRQATMTTQLMLQILPQHLNKWKFRRFVGFIDVAAVCVH